MNRVCIVTITPSFTTTSSLPHTLALLGTPPILTRPQRGWQFSGNSYILPHSHLLHLYPSFPSFLFTYYLHHPSLPFSPPTSSSILPSLPPTQRLSLSFSFPPSYSPPFSSSFPPHSSRFCHTEVATRYKSPPLRLMHWSCYSLLLT